MIVDGIPSHPRSMWTRPMIQIRKDRNIHDSTSLYRCPAHLPPPTEQELDDYVQFGIEPVCSPPR